MQQDLLMKSRDLRNGASGKPTSRKYLLNIPGRLRIRIGALKGNPRLCARIMETLSDIPGIIAVTANHYTAKVLMVYNEKSITFPEIRSRLNGLFDAAKKQKPEKAKIIKANFQSNRVLGAKEFSESKNVLSNDSHTFQIKTLQNTAAGIRNVNLWHTLSAKEAEEALDTSVRTGITREEAMHRLEKYGRNQFEKQERKSILSMLMGQFSGFLTKMLLAASGISFLLGQVVDAAAILTIIGVEALIGVWQEYKAQKSIDMLKVMSTPRVFVIRSGTREEIPADQLVPGDILCLEAGNVVPADARLIESCGLQTVESSLTGEAYPIYKRSDVIPGRDVLLGDRSNMVYMGTSIVKGNGRAVVVATGMETEMGRIAGMLNHTEEERTPLQKNLDHLARFITWCCLGVCGVITLGGILGGNPLVNMFATGISLAVGAIPEGLTTVLAISFAFATQRMAKKKAIVKSLPSMETLSCTKVICTDKTGTLTRNEMTVKGIYTLDKEIRISGEGYHSNGSFFSGEKEIRLWECADLKALITTAAMCNNAQLIKADGGQYRISGDPTEAALLIAAEKSGIRLAEFDCYKREHEIPFDSDVRKMTAICSDAEGKQIVFVKGAMDTVLNQCTKAMAGEATVELTEDPIRQIREANDRMADKAWRVLALAYKPLGKKLYAVDSPEIEKDLVFLGLVGIMDPPRPEVKNALQKCHTAGIKVVMITGDHKNTAAAIAGSIGLLTDRGIVLSSEEVERLTEEELSETIDRVEVFARSCPEQKLKIVRAFKKKGYIVAMTGDGVNDAPALKEAHIGIAMGQSGTETAKDAASIILMDDRFDTVVKAVEEGRTVHRNVRKFMKFVLSGNLAEVLAIFFASVSGLPSPLIPAQILMLNLVTEGIPALSLGVDPPEKNIMKDPPRDPKKSIFDPKLRNRILTRGIAAGLTTLGIFGSTLFLTGSLPKARTMAFANLVSSQMFHAFECSSMGIRRNKYLLPSVVLSSALLLVGIYVPPLAGILGMVRLNPADWALIALSSAVLSRLDGFIKDILYLARIRKRPSFGV